MGFYTNPAGKSNGPRTGQGDDVSAYQYPHTRSFAFTVLAALVILFALRHVFGSISASVGTR